MSWVAVGIAGASLVGGMLQGDSNRRAMDDASKEQGYASQRASGVMRDMYNQQRADTQPWRDQGLAANTSLANNDFMDNWQADPGFQFRMQQGQKAINAGAAARGMGNSGSTLKALANYGQDYGSQEYDKIYGRQYNRLSNLAGTGANLQNGLMGASQNFGNQSANNYMGYGNAMGAASIAGANSQNQMIGQTAGTLASLYGSYRRTPEAPQANEPTSPSVQINNTRNNQYSPY